MCLCSVGQNITGKLPVAGTTLADHQQPTILQDDHDYSTVDDMQQQMFAISGNPAYKAVAEHSQHPLQEEDRAYSNIDISQQEAVVSSGQAELGTALGATTTTKWQSFFIQCQQVNRFPEPEWIEL